MAKTKKHKKKQQPIVTDPVCEHEAAEAISEEAPADTKATPEECFDDVQEAVEETVEEVVEEASAETGISPRESFILSLEKAGRRDLAGRRIMKPALGKMLSKFLWTAVACALIAIIVWQSAEVIAAKIEYSRGNNFYEDLANKLSLSAGDNGLVSTLYGEKTGASLPDYEEMQNGAVIIDKQTLTSAEKKELAIYNAKLAVLKKQNPDTVGWIHSPGTNIDYPIVLAPKNDPDYYISHSFTGAADSHGAIYIEAKCYGSILKNKNTIIVGHNIRLQGMMFNQLARFGEEDFFKDHSEVYVYTEEGKFVFNLFSFYRVNYMYNFRQTNFKSGTDFMDYMAKMNTNSWYQREGLSYNEDSRIITMYTCTNDNVKTNRYVAVAVMTDCLLNE